MWHCSRPACSVRCCFARLAVEATYDMTVYWFLQQFPFLHEKRVCLPTLCVCGKTSDDRAYPAFRPHLSDLCRIPQTTDFVCIRTRIGADLKTKIFIFTGHCIGWACDSLQCFLPLVL